MSSSRRTRANRQNAQHSTGPVTPQGKAAVAQNARNHGLSGRFTLLAHENRGEFEALLNEYQNEFAPKSAHEKFLVEEMAQARWTLARARRIEGHLFEQLAGSEPAHDADARIAAALNTKSGTALATVQRYASAADRAYFRAHRVLLQGRSAQIRNKASEAQAWLQNVLKRTPPPPAYDPTRWDSVPPPSTFTATSEFSAHASESPGHS